SGAFVGQPAANDNASLQLKIHGDRVQARRIGNMISSVSEIVHSARVDFVFVAFGGADDPVAALAVGLGLDNNLLRQVYADARERFAGALVADGADDRFARRGQVIDAAAVETVMSANPAVGRPASGQGMQIGLCNCRSVNAEFQEAVAAEAGQAKAAVL